MTSSQPKTPSPIAVRIVGSHPWSGYAGVINPEDGGFVAHRILGRGPDMYKVALENGHECFASKANLRTT